MWYRQPCIISWEATVGQMFALQRGTPFDHYCRAQFALQRGTPLTTTAELNCSSQRRVWLTATSAPSHALSQELATARCCAHAQLSGRPLGPHRHSWPCASPTSKDTSTAGLDSLATHTSMLSLAAEGLLYRNWLVYFPLPGRACQSLEHEQYHPTQGISLDKVCHCSHTNQTLSPTADAGCAPVKSCTGRPLLSS